MILQVLVISEQRVPVQAKSVAVHCGEEALTVEVSQNFLGNCLFELTQCVSCFCLQRPIKQAGSRLEAQNGYRMD